MTICRRHHSFAILAHILLLMYPAGAADSDGDDYDGGGGYGWDAADLDPGNDAADLIDAPHLVGKLVINYSRAAKEGPTLVWLFPYPRHSIRLQRHQAAPKSSCLS